MIADHEEARRSPAAGRRGALSPAAAGRLYLDRAEWDAMLLQGQAVAFSPYGKPDGAAGIDAGGRPGAVFTKAGAGAGGTAFAQLKEQVANWATAEPPHRGRRLDPRLARTPAPPPAGERHQGRAGRHLGGRAAPPASPVAVVTLGLERGFVAARLRPGRRAGPAGRAHQPPAAPPQARRPVHRRGHRDRRRRPGRPPGLRHRPLRRAGDPPRRPGPARLPAPDLRRNARSSTSRSRTSSCCPASAARRRRGAGQAGRRRLADAARPR